MQAMKQYTVIALSVHSDKIQRVFNAGDVISEEMLHESAIPELIAGGFIAEIEEDQSSDESAKAFSDEEEDTEDQPSDESATKANATRRKRR